MKLSRRLFSVFAFLTFAVSSSFAASLTTGEIGTFGALTSGADPFFWASTAFAIEGTIDSGAAVTSCGVNCSTYTPASMFVEINNDPALLYSVANPALTIFFNPGGDSSYSLSGVIVVSSTFITAINASAGVVDGTLDAGSLTNPPVFGPVAIDSASPLSMFTYQIVGGGPAIGAALGPASGVAFDSVVAAADAPEPSAIWMLGGGLAFLGFFRGRLLRRGLVSSTCD